MVRIVCLSACIFYRSDYAMLYNDRSVLENHHLYFTFMIIREVSGSIMISDVHSKHLLSLSLSVSLSLSLPLHPTPVILQDESDVLNGLSSEQYAQVRKMMVDMVLATDMSTHFDQIKQLKLILSGQDA